MRKSRFFNLMFCFALFGVLVCHASAFAVQRFAYQPNAEARNQSKPSIQHRLRITWGGGGEKRWQGKVSIAGGQFSGGTTLGFSRDSASFLKFQDTEILIDQSSDSGFEGFDVDINAEIGSRFTIEMTGQDGKRFVQELDLSTLIVQDQVFVLDQQNSRLSVARAPGDLVQFRSDRQHLIFAPGEKFEFEFRGNRLRQPLNSSHCRTQICVARTQEVVSRNQAFAVDFDEANCTPFQRQSLKVPDKEGVYNLKIQLGANPADVADGAMQNSIRVGRKGEIVEREIQFVVIEPSVSHGSSKTEQLVMEIVPADLRNNLMTEPLSQFSRRIGLRSVNASAGKFQIDRNLQQVLLPEGGWQAIPVSVDQIGQQHVVEIEYAADAPMAMGCSILQTDASGQVPHFGAESGMKVPVGRGEVGQTQKHRFTFWPENRQVFLLLANRDQKTVCRYRKIRIYALDANDNDVSAADAAVKSGGSKRAPRKRKHMLFYEQPLFAENFASQNYMDKRFGQPISDWLTFYNGIRRLIVCIKDSGSSGAFVNVLGEGSSLMPLETFKPGPRYDSGAFSSAGFDPQRKDVVELMYRMFEREGLALVPVLAFDHRFSEIEFSGQSDCFPVNHRGQKIRGGESSKQPVYNPLCPLVQQSVNQVIAEITDRYRTHRAFEGVAVICRPDTCTLLPGSKDAGYDETTIQKFWQWNSDPDETKSTGRKLFENANFSRWLQYRRLQMSNWYRQIGRVVASADSDAKLYLAFVDLFRNEEIASILSPSLHRDVDINQAMLRLGLESGVASESENIVMMQPTRLAPIHSLASKRSDTVAANSDAVVGWFGETQYPANLFSQRSAWARFEKLEESGYFNQPSQQILRLQQIDLAGDWNRERFAQAILKSDTRMMVDGGVLLSTSIDSGMRRFMSVYSTLPDAGFENVDRNDSQAQQHPVAVRSYRDGENLYLYCVNGSPWPAKVNIGFRGDREKLAAAAYLGEYEANPFGLSGESAMSAEVPPFGLIGLRCADYSIRFTGFEYQFDEIAQNELRDSYYKLRSRLIASGNARDIGVLTNAGFETSLDNGWTSGDSSRQIVQLQNKDAYLSNQCLRIDHSMPESMWVRSNSFATTATGRLSISVWLKTDDAQSQPPLRISIESNDPESEYYRFAELGSLVADKRVNQLNSEWKRFAVHFDDLPQDLSSSIRIGFDMMGAGKVWIDDVQVYDRWLDEKDLKAMTQIFASVGPMIRQPEKLEQCRQVLKGYWPLFLQEYFDESAGQAGAGDSVNNVSGELEPVKNPVRSSMRKRFRRFVAPGIFQFR